MKKFFMITVTLLLTACGTGPDFYAEYDAGDTETSSDSDSDTDSDVDTDTDIDSDSDTDSDTETGTETDTGTDTSTEDTDTGTACPTEGASLDAATGLCWQIAGSSIGSKAAAVAYCDGLVLGDFDDWRLTSKDDHLSILSGCSDIVLGGGIGYCGNCATSPTCHELLGTAGDVGCYWLNDYAGPGLTWGICLTNGYIATGPDVNPDGYVRCVRAVE